ncbi:MAG: hypothetical protein HGB11_02120 [Chlorobiales bacterium]|nr:hypothetical protein [Chlorobiales bacterium]
MKSLIARLTLIAAIAVVSINPAFGQKAPTAEQKEIKKEATADVKTDSLLDKKADISKGTGATLEGEKAKGNEKIADKKKDAKPSLTKSDKEKAPSEIDKK